MALSEMGSCGILKNTAGQIACWGRGDILGDGTSTGDERHVAGIIPDFDNVNEITAGAYHMCAIKSDNTLWCWGNNIYGQIGDNTNTTWTTPAEVTALENPVISVAAGRMFTCAVTQAAGEESEAYCWGKGDRGQLGDGLMTDSTTPQKVLGLEGVGKIDGIYISIKAPIYILYISYISDNIF